MWCHPEVSMGPGLDLAALAKSLEWGPCIRIIRHNVFNQIFNDKAFNLNLLMDTDEDFMNSFTNTCF